MKYKQRFKDIPIDKSWTNEKDRERFINEIAELAFGFLIFIINYSH